MGFLGGRSLPGMCGLLGGTARPTRVKRWMPITFFSQYMHPSITYIQRVKLGTLCQGRNSCMLLIKIIPSLYQHLCCENRVKKASSDALHAAIRCRMVVSTLTAQLKTRSMYLPSGQQPKWANFTHTSKTFSSSSTIYFYSFTRRV